MSCDLKIMINFLTIVLTYSCSTIGQEWNLKPDYETQRINMIVDIITLNLKKNGWSTILCFGNFPDEFYNRLQNFSYPFAITNIDRDDADIGDVVRYYANTIVLNLQDIEEYEDSILKLRDWPYWHPHSNIILYYHQKDLDNLPELYFSLWYYKAINAIIVQYDDTQEMLLISHYTPFITDDYKLDNIHGCWTTRKIGLPVLGFHVGFTCEKNCQNVSITSKHRANYLGTCIGFSIIEVPYNASKILSTINLFPDKTENLHGFQLRAYTTEVKPFLLVTDHGNGSYTLGSRDGMIWNSISKLMNFKIDLTPSKDVVKKPFNFEVNIKQLFSFAFRNADLYLGPIYLFDVAVVELDYVYPYKESGVCIVSHQTGYVTTLFDINTIQANQNVTIKFVLCFLCVWVTFTMYQGVEKGHLSFDQIGKDFLNALRNVLLITLCKPPKRRSFRIFLTISIWSYFVINFAMQASIISVFTVAKKGKRVETFDDVIDKGYSLYGMASPDLFLPDTEKKFRIINSRLVPVQELYECVESLAHNSHIFCLVDCSVAHYLERNLLNEEGEQYLHIPKDRIHSHYLTMLQTKHSALTNRLAKYMLAFYEAGLIKKWEQYRFNDIKEDPPVKPLAMEDLKSFFYVYAVSVGLIFILFLMELLIFHVRKVIHRRFKKVKRYNEVNKFG